VYEEWCVQASAGYADKEIEKVMPHVEQQTGALKG
jgi:hypothetical protein